MELVPQAREMIEHGRHDGHGAAASRVAKILDDILARPEHAWFEEGAERETERVRMKRRSVPTGRPAADADRRFTMRRDFLKIPFPCSGGAGCVLVRRPRRGREDRRRVGGDLVSGRSRVAQGAVPLLRYRLRVEARRSRRSVVGRARRRREPGQPRAALRQGLPRCRPSLRRRPISPIRSCRQPDGSLRSASRGRKRSIWSPRSIGKASSTRTAPSRFRSTARASGRSSTATPPRSGCKCRDEEQQPRAERASLHGERGHGLHDPVPERRADGLLRGLRGR